MKAWMAKMNPGYRLKGFSQKKVNELLKDVKAASKLYRGWGVKR
jgi:hypothetical protein